MARYSFGRELPLQLPPPLLRHWTWRAAGACRSADPNLFYDAVEGSEQERLAKKVCSGCTVRNQCREYAIRANETDGIWGGMNTTERRRMRWAYPGSGVTLPERTSA